jgi:drug/metabolite transporter (DMT)-like permease
MRVIWPYLLVLIAGSVWGSTFSLARIAAQADYHPIGLGFWQALGGGMLLAVVSLVRGKWPRLNRDNLIRFTVIAVLGTAVPGVLYFYAARHLPAGVLAITVALVPMMTYAVSLVLGVDRRSSMRMLGVLLGFVAMVLLSRPEALPDRSMVPWLLVALVAAVCYTMENMYVEVKVPDDTDMICLLMGGMFMATLLMLPVVIAKDAFVPLDLPLSTAEASVVILMLVNSFAYLVFLYLIKSSGAVFASMMGYVVTVAGIGWGIWLFQEQHSILIWIALGLMLIGMAMVRPRSHSSAVKADGKS